MVDHSAERRARLAQQLTKEAVEAFLLSNPVSVTYLTGFSGESSLLLLAKERPLLISDARFTEQIQEECPGLEAYIRPTGQNIYQATASVLGNLGLHSVGFEASHMTMAELEALREGTPTVSWKGTRDQVENLRVIKDDSEVAAIREAIDIAERAFTAFRALLRAEDSEKDLSNALESYVRRCGGSSTSFPSIVAAGLRSALPHAPPTERTLADAPLLLVDWGASGRFYKSDLTRVLLNRKNSAFSRPPAVGCEDTKLEEVYAVVLKAQERAINEIRPGVKGCAVDAAARGTIALAGFDKFFGHGLGHGLGLEVHEAPALRPNAEVVLQPGMVVTVEPGIYLPGWGGIRIEDDVLVTPDGCEVLTRVPRDWQSMLCDF